MGSSSGGPVTSVPEAAGPPTAPVRPPEATEVRAGAGEATAANNGGSTDVGIGADQIKVGGIFSYGHLLGNLAIQPMHREMQAIFKAVNDAGGIHGRRLKYVDCDDGASDPARTRACYKKLVEQDKVFSFMGGVTFNESMYQPDLEKDRTGKPTGFVPHPDQFELHAPATNPHSGTGK